jgi:hypothetical protein
MPNGCPGAGALAKTETSPKAGAAAWTAPAAPAAPTADPIPGPTAIARTAAAPTRAATQRLLALWAASGPSLHPRRVLSCRTIALSSSIRASPAVSDSPLLKGRRSGASESTADVGWRFALAQGFGLI